MKGLVSDLFCQHWQERSTISAIRKSIDVFLPDIATKLPVPLESIAKYLGVSEIIQKPLEGYDGLLMQSPNGSIIIFINSNTSSSRKRFTLAHEIGHIIINRSLGDKSPNELNCDKFNPESKDEEQLCDRIASEILMPNAFLKQFCIDHGIKALSLEMFSNLFGCSKESVARRIAVEIPYDLGFGQWRFESKVNHYVADWFVTRNGRKEIYSIDATSTYAQCFKDSPSSKWYWLNLDNNDTKLYIDIATLERKPINRWIMMCLLRGSGEIEFRNLQNKRYFQGDSGLIL